MHHGLDLTYDELPKSCEDLPMKEIRHGNYEEEFRASFTPHFVTPRER